MGLYIWLLLHEVVIYCALGSCTSASMAHFDYLVGAGAIELIFELAGIIKIYARKSDLRSSNEKEN